MSARISTPGTGSRPADLVVVGGGVMGLSCAWTVAQGGLSVTVVDPGDARSRATWAAGGMLAPLGEAPEPGPFLELALGSLALFPDFAARVEAASGRSVGLHLNGKLLTAATDGDAQRLAKRRDWLQADGHAVRWLDGGQVRALEPALSAQTRVGLLLEGNGRVDNRSLHAGLAEAADRTGVIRVRGRVTALRSSHGRVEGVELIGGGFLPAPAVLVAAGAWSGTISGLPRPLPVQPVKGQMLALSAIARPLTRVVTSPEAYLIPRETEQGPVVVVGATSEDAGFDLTVEPEGQEALLRGAVNLVPSLVDAPVVERWSGLRPGTTDDLPVLGPDPDLSGLFFATGHYRNGILLAPATARALAGWIAGDAPKGMAPFAPDRFSVQQ